MVDGAKIAVPDEMYKALHQTYTSLMTLKAQEEGNGIVAAEMLETPSAPVDWRKSITKHAVTCLACGGTFKQLSVRHLKDHDLDARSYQAKYGIPRSQPLSARSVTALRKQLVQETKPWEKAPRFLQDQEKKKRGKTVVAQRKRTTRTKA